MSEVPMMDAAGREAEATSKRDWVPINLDLRGEARRIISARKAEAHERRIYGEILARNASA